MDRIDNATLFALNLIMTVVLASLVWGVGAFVVAALAGVPLALGAIVGLSLTAKA
ncbi:MAG: hypothetical protein KF895_09970 [Parvibaculum sp.]|nr:hypothetical protein [Parvibaculum sp.]